MFKYNNLFYRFYGANRSNIHIKEDGFEFVEGLIKGKGVYSDSFEKIKKNIELNRTEGSCFIFRQKGSALTIFLKINTDYYILNLNNILKESERKHKKPIESLIAQNDFIDKLLSLPDSNIDMKFDKNTVDLKESYEWNKRENPELELKIEILKKENGLFLNFIDYENKLIEMEKAGELKKQNIKKENQDVVYRCFNVSTPKKMQTIKMLISISISMFISITKIRNLIL